MPGFCCASPTGVRTRDIAASIGITDRSACGIVTDLTAAGYVVKQQHGRRDGCQIQAHLPLPEPVSHHLPSAKLSGPRLYCGERQHVDDVVHQCTAAEVVHRLGQALQHRAELTT
jgi:hypothetical protein